MTGMRPTMPPHLRTRTHHASRAAEGRAAVAVGLDRSHSGDTVRPCVPSVVSPSVPCCPRPWPRWGSSPATCGGRGTRPPRTSSPRSTPSSGSRPAATRCGCSARSTPRRLDELAADQRLPRPARGRPPRPRRATSPGDQWYQRAGRRRRAHARSPTSRRSSASPPCCRSTPAASASSPATTSRRPPTSASRWSASACSTGRATSSSRSPARAGSRRPTRSSTPTSCRSRCSTRRTARARWCGSRSPTTPSWWPGSGSPTSAGCRCCCSTPTSRRTPTTSATVTDRLYGGTSEHRLRQELLLGVGGVRALRAYSRITGAPAPEVFHTNEGHAGFLGLERIRELSAAEGGPRLDFDTALEVSRASTVFTTHTPVPAGHRPVLPRAGRAVLRRRLAGARRPGRADPRRSAPRTTRAATPACSTWR